MSLVRTVGSGDSSTVVNIRLIIMAIVLKTRGFPYKLKLNSRVHIHLSCRKIYVFLKENCGGFLKSKSQIRSFTV